MNHSNNLETHSWSYVCSDRVAICMHLFASIFFVLPQLCMQPMHWFAILIFVWALRAFSGFTTLGIHRIFKFYEFLFIPVYRFKLGNSEYEAVGLSAQKSWRNGGQSIVVVSRGKTRINGNHWRICLGKNSLEILIGSIS